MAERRLLTLTEVHTEADCLIRIGAAVRVDAVQEVVLEFLRLAEAEVHVRLGAGQGRVLGNNILEAGDLHREKISGQSILRLSLAPLIWMGHRHTAQNGMPMAREARLRTPAAASWTEVEVFMVVE